MKRRLKIIKEEEGLMGLKERRIRRRYISAKSLWKLRSIEKVYILTTSRGIMTDRQARKWRIGGEVMYEMKR
jgi:ribosomal protein S8